MNDSTPTDAQLAVGHLHLPRAKLGWFKWAVTLVFLALAVHLLLPAIAGYNQTWQTIRTLSWWLVAMAVAAEVGSYVGSGFLLQGLVRLAGGRLSVIRGSALTLASAAVGIVAAGIVGSTVSMYAWIHQGKTHGTGAWAAASLKPVFNNAVLFAIGTYGIAHLLVLGDLTRTELVGLIVLLAVLVAMASTLVGVATHPEPLRRGLTALNQRWSRLRKTQPDNDRVDRTINQASSAWALVRSGGWERPLLGAVINTTCDVLCLYLLFLAAGDQIGVGAVLAGYSLPLLLGKVAFIPGGIGVVEATMTAVFTSLGIDSSTAIVAVLAYRLISFWVPALIGFILAAKLQRDSSERPRAAE